MTWDRLDIITNDSQLVRPHLMSPINLWKETPLIYSESLSSTLEASVYLKLEVRPVRISEFSSEFDGRISTHHTHSSTVEFHILSSKRRINTAPLYTLSLRRAEMLV